MRRRTVIAPIVPLAAALLAWRRRRARTRAALGTPPAAPPLAAPASAFVSVPWTLVAAPQDRPELTVRYAVLQGLELDRVDAQETPTQVFVTVLARRQPPGDSSAFREEREATVALSAPLGTRELVHAATDPPASASGEPNSPSLYP